MNLVAFYWGQILALDSVFIGNFVDFFGGFSDFLEITFQKKAFSVKQFMFWPDLDPSVSKELIASSQLIKLN